MCGIVGFRSNNFRHTRKYKSKIEDGLDVLKHRGPDGSGLYIDENVILAHRRLSIFDVSDNGAQPMVSRDGEGLIVLNGEIYNFKELRGNFLNDLSLKSTSDTEVLLECFNKIGVEDTLKNVRGMYAFCYHDKRKSITYLGRDFFGEKPLYYFVHDDGLFFSSDINGLLPVLPARIINQSVLKDYLRFGYCPGENSIFKGIMKLPPGCLLICNGNKIEVKQLFSPDDLFQSTDQRYEFKYEKFKYDLHNSVIERSAADVPVGVLLSGGVDSSLVASVLASRGRISTFNLKFIDKDYDESEIAVRVSNYLGTNHSVLEFTANDALDLVPSIPSVFSEPFADISLLPTLAISKFARKTVTVALSGDGGDEFLYGYNKYFQMDKIRRINGLSFNVLKNLDFGWTQTLLGPRKSKFLREAFSDSTNLDLLFASYNRDVEDLLLVDSVDLDNHYIKEFKGSSTIISRIRDIKQYLPDNILVKSDRCSMYNSLELRAPFLDLNVLKSSFAFNSSELYYDGMGKRPLRQLLSEFVPKEVYNVRRKRGFNIPIQKWLKNELRPLVDYQLSEKKLHEDNVFNPQKVRSYYDLFYKHDQNYSQLIWSLLVFNLWYDKYMRS